MTECRGCGESEPRRVLDLGDVPAADHFPRAIDPVVPQETSHPLAMGLCPVCGLAQLADDDTVADEPRGVEPQALKDQAAAALRTVESAGWLGGRTVREFGSPHGGTWLPLLADHGFTASDDRADVVLDCFGMMHERDQRNAFAGRAGAVNPGGVLLLQYHSILTIVRHGQWNALRHGHFAYYSLTTLMRLLRAVGIGVVSAWEFDLYGGTVLVGAVRGDTEPDDSVLRVLAAERRVGITEARAFTGLQTQADRHAASLRAWLQTEVASGNTVMAYGAASRAVALFSRAGLTSELLAGVADASPGKHGRRMPGTDIAIVTPAELLEAKPDRVLLTVPDLLSEVSAQFPEFDGRWQVDDF